MRIGFFDSGLGGLTILRAVRKQLPEYDYFYFGDTANLPYGDRSEGEVYALTERAVTQLFDAGALLVIVACNTASAETLRKLQEIILVGKYADRRLLGVIVPTVETLIGAGIRRALLLATERTARSEKYARELKKLHSDISLIAVPTPSLVPLIEQGDLDSALKAAEQVVALHAGKVDAVVLGCTHYTVLKDGLRKAHTEIRIIAQDELIPEKLAQYLRRHPEIETRLSRRGTVEITESGTNAPENNFKRELLESLRE